VLLRFFWYLPGQYLKFYYGTLKEVGREEDLRIAGEDRSSKKWVEAGMN